MDHKYNNKNLAYQNLATIFIQLSQMESAGIAAIESFALLGKIEKNNTQISKPLLKVQHYFNSGNSIAEATYKAGLFNSTLRAIINSAEKSGTLALVYKHLAVYYQQKSSHLKNIKSKLYLPLLMLLLALLIQPIPLLIKSEITFLAYLGLSLGRFTLMLICFFVLLKLPLWFKSIFYSLQIQLPLINDWVIKRQFNTFFQFLGIMLGAGLTFENALPLAVSTIENPLLKNRFHTAIDSCHKGDSVKLILSQVNGIPPATLHIIYTGEESGRLAQSILHFTNIEAETLHLQDDSLTTWLPRFFYFTVTIWIAASLIG